MVTIFIIFFLNMFLILGLGKILLSKGLTSYKNWPSSMKIGASWFVGICIQVSVIRTTTFIVNNAKISISIAFVFFILTFFYFIRWAEIRFYFEFQRKKFKYWLFLPFLIGPYILLYWLPYSTSPEDVNALIGSLHAGRYAALSNYILKCNYIPIVGQNTVQSILISSLSLFVGSKPFLFLFLFLLSSILFFSVFTYGIVSLVSKNRMQSAICSFIFMMGNTALSFAHVMTIDSGSPFGLNGYTDTLLGSFITIFLLLIYSSKELTFHNKPLIILTTIILIVCFFSSPQNIVLLVASLSIFSIIGIIKKKRFGLKIWWVLAIVALLNGLPQGGMLTPRNLVEKIPLPGIQSVENSKKGLVLDPWVPFYITIYSHWEKGNDQTRWFGGDGLFTVYKGANNHFSEIIYFYELTMIMALRNFFFPILGIFLLYFSNKKRNELNLVSNDILNPQHIYIVAFTMLIVGTLICYPFSLNSYKLELSRFMIPAIALGELGLVMAISSPLYLGLFYRPIFFLICMSVIGPLSNSFFRVLDHFENLHLLPFSQMYSQGLHVSNSVCGKKSVQSENRERGSLDIISFGLAPSESIDTMKTIDFNIELSNNKRDRLLKGVGILLTNSGLLENGTVSLKLVDQNSDTLVKKLNLSDLLDNQYNYFEFEPRRYKSIALFDLDSRGVKIWSKNQNSCLVFLYGNEKVLSNGCPEPLK